MKIFRGGSSIYNTEFKIKEKEKMKKTLSLLLAILMIFSVCLVSCGGGNDDDKDNDKDSENLAFDDTEPKDTDPVDSDPVDDQPQDYAFTEVNQTVYVQNCTKVNLRTSPSALTNDNIAGALKFADGKSYTRTGYNEKWSRLEIDGEEFYVNTYFLTDKAAEVVFTEMSKTVYVNNIDEDGETHGLYLRSFTSTNPDPEFYPNNNIAGVAGHGAALIVTGISKNEKWYRVNYTDPEGNEIKSVYVYNGPYISDTVPTGEPTTNTQTPDEPAVG